MNQAGAEAIRIVARYADGRIIKGGHSMFQILGVYIRMRKFRSLDPENQAILLKITASFVEG
jgi:hypothetical protein